MSRNLKTVSQFANGSPWTEAQLRWFIHNSSQNGMGAAGALVRCGRRVFIDLDGFDRWLVAQNPGLRPVERDARAGGV